MDMYHIRPTELTEDNEMYEADVPNARVALKQHQRVALARCLQMENVGLHIPYGTRYSLAKSKIGILADSVGSGKSYVMLSVMATNAEPEVDFNRVNVFADDKLYVEYNRPHTDLVDLNVVVCSFGLVDQWKTYAQTFFGTSLTNLFVISRKNHIDGFRKLVWGRPRYNHEEDEVVDREPRDSRGAPNIVIVASTMYHLLAETMQERNARVTRVVFDEADSAVTPKAYPIDARYYWLMTASWRNVIQPIYNYNINSMHTGIVKNTFLRNIFMTFMRALPFVDKVNLLGGMIVKNDDEFVKRSFHLPGYNQQYILCKDPIAAMLNGVTQNSLVLRAINAGDMETAIGLLDKNNRGDENHITDLVMGDLKKDLHNCVQTIQYVEQLIVVNPDTRRERLENLRKEEKHLITRIELLTERIRQSSDCLVCFTPPENRCITTCCKNTFCFECICKWLNVRNSCPLCRENITVTDNLMMITDEGESDSVDDGDEGANDQASSSSRQKKWPLVASKFDTLSRLLRHIREQNAEAKILIFSEYDRVFERIAATLASLDLRFGMLKGQALKKNLERFRAGANDSDKMDILMINSTAYGSGMNLENSTDVILFHHSNQQTEAQVIGRAQRPGRKSPLNVWHLLNSSERQSMETEANSSIEMFSFHN